MCRKLLGHVVGSMALGLKGVKVDIFADSCWQLLAFGPW